MTRLITALFLAGVLGGVGGCGDSKKTEIVVDKDTPMPKGGPKGGSKGIKADRGPGSPPPLSANP